MTRGGVIASSYSMRQDPNLAAGKKKRGRVAA